MNLRSVIFMSIPGLSLDHCRIYGFTTEEVKKLCQKYDKDYTIMQEWYDGYTVGGVHVYNPKSVMDQF